jgi:hypothetical protein
VRLVVVAERDGQARPVDLAAVGGLGGGLVQAVAADHPRRAESHVVGEQALDRPDAEREPLGQLGHPGHVTVLLEQRDGAVGERALGVGLGGQQRLERRLHRRHRALEVGRLHGARERLGVEPGERRGGQATVADRGHGLPEQRPQPARPEPQADRPAGAGQRPLEALPQRPVEPGATLLDDEVGRGVRQRGLVVRLAAAQVPDHDPVPDRVGREPRPRVEPVQRPGVLRRCAQDAAGFAHPPERTLARS